ncbi:C1 family peptidase [soil metagenome]
MARKVVSRATRKSAARRKPQAAVQPLKRAFKAAKTINISVAAGVSRKLDALPDIPDIRDRMFEPPLIDLATRWSPSSNFLSPILDQGTEGSCTGFALAATINLLLNKRFQVAGLQLRSGGGLVSTRMLYEMAKVHDEWPGDEYEGSSLRGALKGFYHNGVCTDGVAPYKPGEKKWGLTVERAHEARQIGLGAYYRLRPEMIDYHAALNQVGAIYVSARVHDGWINPENGVIKPSSREIGGHAFVIVGYDDRGFLIQNSWGPAWGNFQNWGGIAHWCYEDWAKAVTDAWVLRLAVPTPDAFDLTIVKARLGSAASAHVDTPAPRRDDVLGHFAHIDNGKFVETGTYGTSLQTIQATADFLTKDAGKEARDYRHLMFYAHGGLNDANAAARYIFATKDGFKRNGIYPFHFMWETGFFSELLDLLGLKMAQTAERVGGIFDFTDMLIEAGTSSIGLRFWREMKIDAARAFAGSSAAGLATLKTLLTANAALKKPRPVHFVGHSAGAILIAEMLASLNRANAGQKLDTMSILAPACTTDVYRRAYLPALRGPNPTIRNLWQYNLSDAREQDDNVAAIYRKSLLYLVSNAFEDRKHEPLLGMEVFSSQETLPKNHVVYYAGSDAGRSHTDGKGHTDFDNDATTLNDILTNILATSGEKLRPDRQFKDGEVKD